MKLDPFWRAAIPRPRRPWRHPPPPRPPPWPPRPPQCVLSSALECSVVQSTAVQACAAQCSPVQSRPAQEVSGHYVHEEFDAVGRACSHPEAVGRDAFLVAAEYCRVVNINSIIFDIILL